MENNLEENLSAILNDPQMMQKIQAMAQSLSQTTVSEASPKAPPSPEIDFSTIQQLAGLAGQTGIDSDQQALLSALSPYIARSKISKLENAMRAAKLARLASGFLGSGTLQKLIGR